MRLTPEDEAWLEGYRQALAEQFPGVVERFIIYGSKARGTATADSDLDVLLVIRDGDRRLKAALKDPGHELSIDTDAVPSIQVFTVAEWERLGEQESVFREAVERDGVLIR